MINKVLVVCLGNICRSPIGQGILQHLSQQAKLDLTIHSAGTNGFHTGEHPHPSSIKVCKQYGIDISTQVSRRFVVTDFDIYDSILVMAKDVYDDVKSLNRTEQDMEKVHFFLDSIAPGKLKNVTDPYYGTEAGYTTVYKTIEEASIAWLRVWQQD
jgi:protein-tyrosine phosphatase